MKKIIKALLWKATACENASQTFYIVKVYNKRFTLDALDLQALKKQDIIYKLIKTFTL